MTKTKEARIEATQDRKTMMWEGQKNTFGLLPGLPSCGGTCENATTEKGGCFYTPPGRKLPVCYVFSKMNFRPAIKALLKRNTDLLVDAKSKDQQAMFRCEFDRFLAADEKHGVKRHFYRIHWSGDCPDTRYTANLRADMEEYPQIQFWGYSRNLFTVPIRSGLKNCTWRISTDIVNRKTHLEYLTRKGFIGIDGLPKNNSNISYCYMSTENDISAQLFSCPTDTGQMEFVGACARCMNCVTGRQPVYFKTK